MLFVYPEQIFMENIYIKYDDIDKKNDMINRVKKIRNKEFSEQHGNVCG